MGRGAVARNLRPRNRHGVLGPYCSHGHPQVNCLRPRRRAGPGHLALDGFLHLTGPRWLWCAARVRRWFLALICGRVLCVCSGSVPWVSNYLPMHLSMRRVVPGEEKRIWKCAEKGAIYGCAVARESKLSRVTPGAAPLVSGRTSCAAEHFCLVP